MGFKDRFTALFGLGEDTEDMYEEGLEDAQQAPTEQSARKFETGRSTVVPMVSRGGNSVAKISVVEPRVYAEVTKVTDLLLNNESVLLNLKRVDEVQARQIVDFLSGATYAIKGDLQKVSAEIFLCTPASVTVDGVLSENLLDSSAFDLQR